MCEEVFVELKCIFKRGTFHRPTGRDLFKVIIMIFIINRILENVIQSKSWQVPWCLNPWVDSDYFCFVFFSHFRMMNGIRYWNRWGSSLLLLGITHIYDNRFHEMSARSWESASENLKWTWTSSHEIDEKWSLPSILGVYCSTYSSEGLK